MSSDSELLNCVSDYTNLNRYELFNNFRSRYRHVFAGFAFLWFSSEV